MTEFKFFPQVVVWEITFACNMRCIHCGTSAGKRRPDELTTAEALGLIDELADLGCESLTLSGGEPLLRDDWVQLAERSKARQMRTYLITNGYAVTPEIADTLAGLKLNNVGLSFDGSEKTHNFIRQRPDSYQRVIDSMRMFDERGMRFCAVSQISNINLGDLDFMRDKLIEVGCKAWRIQMTTTTGRMKDQADMILSRENYPKLVNKLLELKKDTRIMVDVGENIGYYGCKGTELLDGMPYFGCYAGTRVAGIESNGAVKGCLSMQEDFVEGNIRERSFTEIWNDPTKFLYNRKFTRDTATGACHDCRYLGLCRGGCTTTSWSQSGERANNPYCIYQMELAQGIQPNDPPEVVSMLEYLAQEEAKHEGSKVV